MTRVSREQGGTRVQAPRAPLGARGEEKTGHVLVLGGWMGARKGDGTNPVLRPRLRGLVALPCSLVHAAVSESKAALA